VYKRKGSIIKYGFEDKYVNVLFKEIVNTVGFEVFNGWISDDITKGFFEEDPMYPYLTAEDF